MEDAKQHPERPYYERLGAQDSSFVMFEHRATHMHVSALAFFDAGPLRTGEGGLEGDRIARFVESRLSALPRYRQRLAFMPLDRHPIWVDDEHFDLRYHVRHTALPRPGSEERLKHLVARILSQPLDRDRPLWEMWLVEGLEGDRFALVTKVHHCMVDGASGVGLMGLLFRDTPSDDIPPVESWLPRPRPSEARLVLEEVVARAAMPASILRSFGDAVRHPGATATYLRDRGSEVSEALRAGFRTPSRTPLNEPIGPHRRVEWRRHDLAEIKALRHRLEGTVNDVVLTVVTGAIRRFLMRRGESLENVDYRVVIPVDMRAGDLDREAANRVSGFFMSLPIDEADPLVQFARVHRQTLHMKSSRAADGIDFFTQLVDRSRSSLLTRIGVRFAARMQPFNQIVSNVPGPQFPLYVLGARMLALHPLPPLFEEQGLGVAVLSYDGGLCWGLTADRDLVPDLGALGDDLDAALRELGEKAPSRAATRARSTGRSERQRVPAPGQTPSVTS